MTAAGPAAPAQAPSVQERSPVAELLRRRLFFIVGCQKSGTTWVQHILDGHDQIRCNGEAYFGPVLLPALRQALGTYNERQKVGQEGRFTDDDLRAVFTCAVTLLFERWVGDDNVLCLGEKTPEHAMCLPVLNELFPSMRVIHIIRDGRDVAVSGWFHNLRKGGEKFRARFPSFSDYIQYLVQAHWVAYINAARSFGHAHPHRYLELRYEQLHDEPEDQIVRMLDFLEVDRSPQCVRCCAQSGAFETLASGRHRGEEDRSSFFRKGVVGDWRREFDDRCVATFERFGGKMLRELGYAVASEERATESSVE